MSSRRGFALLEVLVALAVLGIAGLALVEVAGQGLATLNRVRDVERRVSDEDRLMAAYTLLNGRDLEERLGWRRVGPYDVRVDRLDFGLFRVNIGPADAGPELTTVIYRPGPHGGGEQ